MNAMGFRSTIRPAIRRSVGACALWVMAGLLFLPAAFDQGKGISQKSFGTPEEATSPLGAAYEKGGSQDRRRDPGRQGLAAGVLGRSDHRSARAHLVPLPQAPGSKTYNPNPKYFTAKAPRTPRVNGTLGETKETSEGPRKGSSGSWIERSKQGLLGDPGTQRWCWVVLAVKDFPRFRDSYQSIGWTDLSTWNFVTNSSKKECRLTANSLRETLALTSPMRLPF